MILSILICSLHERAAKLARLLDELQFQAAGHPVEVLVEVDNRQITTGEKRNILLERAQGKYVVFIDDDDVIAPDYIYEILKATRSNPDVISFEGVITVNNGLPIRWILSKDQPYITSRDEYGNQIYLRYSNHLSPTKRDLALQIRYKHIIYQEDFDYATRLRESGLLKTEVFIPKQLYYYKYINKEKETPLKKFIKLMMPGFLYKHLSVVGKPLLKVKKIITLTYFLLLICE